MILGLMDVLMIIINMKHMQYGKRNLSILALIQTEEWEIQIALF